MTKKSWIFFDLTNIVLMCLFSLCILYPFIYILSTSLSSPINVLQGKISFYPKGFDIRSYVYLLSNSRIPLAFWNTIKYTIMGTSVNIIMTTIAAYPLSKKDFFGRKLFMKMIIITMLFNGGIIPNYILVNSLHMIDTMWALIIPTAISAFYLIMAISFYQTIPAELEESAKIDGASVYRILFQIIIPLSKPVIAALVLFYSMYHYNNFFAPLIYLNDRMKQPLQIVLKDMIVTDSALTEGKGILSMGDYAPESLKHATIIVSLLPMLIVYPFIQKRFVQGVMVGALKG